MKNRIDLPNRDGMKVWLEKVEGEKYLLKIEKDYPIQVTYSSNNKEDISAVDPSGGPMIYVGCFVDDKNYVKKIEWIKGEGFIITLN